jgi:hypothetical protein
MPQPLSSIMSPIEENQAMQAFVRQRLAAGQMPPGQVPPDLLAQQGQAQGAVPGLQSPYPDTAPPVPQGAPMPELPAMGADAMPPAPLPGAAPIPGAPLPGPAPGRVMFETAPVPGQPNTTAPWRRPGPGAVPGR